MRKRIQRTRTPRTRYSDRLIELSPGVYMFEPAWAAKRREAGK